jgi:vancomycin resistance protein YoaR
VSTDTVPPPPPSTSRRTRAWALVGGFVLGLALLYGLLVAFSGTGIPRGTSVLGVDIGGLSTEAAQARLETALAEPAAAPIKVTVDGDSDSVAPEQLGLSFDAPATVAAAEARTFNPIRLITRIFASHELEPVVAVDQATMGSYLADVAATVDVPAKDGGVEFTQTSAEPVASEPGKGLDRAGAEAALRAAYLHGTGPVDLVVAQVQPAVDDAAVQAALDTFAIPAMSAPVQLTVRPSSGRDPSTVTLRPKDFGPALAMEPAADGTLAPVVKVKALRAVVDSRVGDGLRAPKDARIVIRDGKPRVVAAVKGQSVNDQELTAAMLAVLPRTTDRTATVGVQSLEPELTTAEAKALGVKELLATFTQPFPYAAYRVTNIGRAADYIDGTLLMPGDTFSMNGTVKERTVENGYTVGTVIAGGRFREELGGGVSTITTAMWHTAFYAGMERVEQRGHSFYISRYLPGLEATVAWGSLDLKFRNDSPHAVLIKASITNSSVTISMYGTKRYKISADFGPRTNVRAYKTVYDPEPGCVPQPGVEGFKIVVTRVFHDLEGKVVKREPLTTSYNVANDIHCGSKPKPDKPKPSSSPKPSKSG